MNPSSNLTPIPMNDCFDELKTNFLRLKKRVYWISLILSLYSSPFLFPSSPSFVFLPLYITDSLPLTDTKADLPPLHLCDESSLMNSSFHTLLDLIDDRRISQVYPIRNMKIKWLLRRFTTKYKFNIREHLSILSDYTCNIIAYRLVLRTNQWEFCKQTKTVHITIPSTEMSNSNNAT